MSFIKECIFGSNTPNYSFIKNSGLCKKNLVLKLLQTKKYVSVSVKPSK